MKLKTGSSILLTVLLVGVFSSAGLASSSNDGEVGVSQYSFDNNGFNMTVQNCQTGLYADCLEIMQLARQAILKIPQTYVLRTACGDVGIDRMLKNSHGIIIKCRNP